MRSFGRELPENCPLYANGCDKGQQLLLDSRCFSLIVFNPGGIQMENPGFFLGNSNTITLSVYY